MPIYVYDSSGNIQKVNNTLSDGITVNDSINLPRQASSVWVNDGISWKQVYQKSPYDLTSTHKKRDMMFIGDSITWGLGLTQTQNYVYNIQSIINSYTGYTSSGWTSANFLSALTRAMSKRVLT